MADDGNQENALAAVFPSPPPFYKHFTPDNIRRIAELREQQQNEVVGADVPSDLQWLVPPEPPSSGAYQSFGDFFDINAPLPTLRSQGVEQLYTTPPGSPSQQSWAAQRSDRAQDMIQMARSILLNFLELVGLLSLNPEAAAQKIDDLRTLFINVHHLINEYRPHQARESLITMMQEQLQQRKAEILAVTKMKEKVDNLLGDIAKTKIDDIGTKDAAASPLQSDDITTGKQFKVTIEREKAVWDALNSIK